MNDRVAPLLQALAWATSHRPETLAMALALLAAPAWLLLEQLVRRPLRRHPVALALAQRLRWALRALWLALVLRAEAELLHAHLRELDWLPPLMRLLPIGVLTWLAIRLVQAAGEVALLRRGGVQLPDDPRLLDVDLHARGAITRARVFTRVASLLIALVGLSAMLMSIPDVRQIGTSLLASAGIAGVVVGFAARPVLSNLLAGLQIALTEPIRINDVLIVQGQWGRVEEITGTYVVFRIWDERRMIFPLQWFIENPFENWTRTSASLLASVYVWVDYAMPIEPIRAELQRLCAQDPDWDGRLTKVHVTDANQFGQQVRLLVSAANSARSWELQCRVREGVIAYLQQHWPQHLPRHRLQLQPDAPGPHDPPGPRPAD
ncbi:MAG: mechanosensitive ion channel protein MscS [Thiomonas sp. 13-66-29]|jgi:small-conductance mechanosensitive channel|nr:MAG: mechanosensitive ion channel protein MscS [Thiomonas sp. 13-66-29]